MTGSRTRAGPPRRRSRPTDDADRPVLSLVAAVGPAGTAPTLRGERTRARLVEAAAGCFGEYGYTGTRIADVVHRAGTSQGGFYRHFRGKGDVLMAAIRPVVEELLDATRRSSPPSGTSGVEAQERDERQALVDAATAYLTVYARHRHLMRVTREASSIRGTASVDGGFAVQWLAVRALFSDRTAAWLRSVQATGRLRDVDPELLAEVLGATTEQVAYVHVGLAAQTPRAERLRELGEVVGDVWWRAVHRDEERP